MAPGAGHAGYCKICAHPQAPAFIRGAREGGKRGTGWNAAEAQEFGRSVGLEFNRQTWYKHLEHATTPETRLIQAAEQVRQQGALQSIRDIKKHGANKDVLEAIRDLGMARALNNPDDVTVDQALKAIQIMETRKDKGSDQLNILVAFVTGNPPAVVVEGTAREITDGTDPDA